MQIQPNQPLDETSIACILRDLLHAIEYLHSEGKIHRDLKGSTPPSPKSDVNSLHWFPVCSYITTQSVKPQINFEKVRVIKLEKMGSEIESARFCQEDVDDNWPVCSLYLANSIFY